LHFSFRENNWQDCFKFLPLPKRNLTKRRNGIVECLTGISLYRKVFTYLFSEVYGLTM
jgi:hypothetical protein